MKRLVICVLALASIGITLAARQTTKYGVTVDAAKKVDFAAIRTYAWRRAQPSWDKTVDAQIVAAIDREMSALGMTKLASAPADVLVGYGSLTRTDVNLRGKEDAKGLLPQYWVGTLVVTFHDGGNREVLKMRVDLPIDIKPDQLEASINQAVTLMFAEYPTRKRR
jgi:hypothetical protein